jgi:hypothetical protein
LLNGPFTVPNFDVRCQELTINESSAVPGNNRRSAPGAKETTVLFNVSWKYKLLGKERALAGDYIKSVFDTIKGSKFWTEQGFTGRPEETYKGDQPRENKPIGRVIIEGTLDWQRVKVVTAQATRK